MKRNNLLLLVALAGVALVGLGTSFGQNAITVNLGDLTLKPNYQATNFGQVWDLTAGDLILSYTIDMTGITQPAPWITSYTEVGLRQVGAYNFNPGPFNSYQGGAGGWMTSLVGNLTAGPSSQSLHDKHNLAASGGRGEGDYDVLASPPNVVQSPAFGGSSNYGIWFDRDGVDQWQATYWGAVNGGTYNTRGIYSIVITYHAITPELGTMFVTVNGIQTGFYTSGWKNAQPENYPAGLSFKGDMRQMQVFAGIYSGDGANGNVKLSQITVKGSILSFIEKQFAKSEIEAYLTNGDKRIRDAATKATERIDESLEGGIGGPLWVDENHLTTKGKKVFDKEKEAVNELMEKILKKYDGQVADDAFAAIKDLLLADENLAMIAIDKVECNGDVDCERELAKANEELAKANALATPEIGKYDDAIDRYGKAWEHAMHAGKKAAEPQLLKEAVVQAELPKVVALEQNYPNPFNPSTTIRFALPKDAQVRLVVYDMLGQEVARLVDGPMSAGYHGVLFNASRLSSGIYIYKLETGTFTQVRKLSLVK